MKKGVAKKATKSVKKTNTKKLPKKKGGKMNDNRPRGIEVGSDSKAHAIFTRATLTGKSLAIRVEASQCSNLIRPPVTTFDYQVEFNGRNYGLFAAVEDGIQTRHKGTIKLEVTGLIPDHVDASLDDILTVTVLTKKKVTVVRRIASDGDSFIEPCDSPIGTAKKRVTRTKKKSQK